MSFEQFFKQHYKLAVYIAEKMIQNEGAAEDIACNAFMKMWERGYTENETQMRTFIHLAIKNECIDYIRHKIIADKHTGIIYDNSADFEEAFLLTEIKATLLNEELIRKNLDCLPAQAKRIFEMFWSGLNTRQVAAKMGLTTRTVLNQKTRAIRLLRKRLQLSNQ
jgi:RNA polymerase sigma factor (sigma-70 family)